MSKARILIADDDAAIVQTMTWVLKEHGYDVMAAQRGQTSFRSWKSALPIWCCWT